MAIDVISAKALSERLARGDELLLVDVREPWEQQLARIEGSVLVPLGTLPARLGELPRDREIVFLCHAGVRSMRACLFAQAQGYARVANLEGGIDAWSMDVDPDVPRY